MSAPVLSFPWEDYTLASLLRALDPPPAGNPVAANAMTCLLALVLAECGWDGMLLRRNLCLPLPGGDRDTQTSMFTMLSWKGETLNINRQSHEDILATYRHLPPMAAFSGPGTLFAPSELASGVENSELLAPTLAEFRARLLDLAVEPAAHSSPRARL